LILNGILPNIGTYLGSVGSLLYFVLSRLCFVLLRTVLFCFMSYHKFRTTPGLCWLLCSVLSCFILLLYTRLYANIMHLIFIFILQCECSSLFYRQYVNKLIRLLGNALSIS
jgi:uncharacterized membrane protein YoaK (UPF0700 family)